MSNSNWNEQNAATGRLERVPRLTKALSLLTLSLFALNAPAATRYVDLNSPSSTPPYLDWTTAATNIQDAIDAAVDGDLVLVTNGVYNTGGRTNGDSYLTNRVMVTKPLAVRSVNGAAHTIIQGYQVPGTTNSDAATRCVLLGYGASLTGFTLTNGATLAPGGALVTSDQDVIGGGILCLSTNEVVSNCVLIANSAYSGGAGAYSGTLNNCALSNNIPGPYGQHGAGAHLSVLNDCIVSGSRSGSAGGVNSVVMNNCLVISNWYFGARKSTLNNCTLIGNSGGAADSCTLVNCVIQGNFTLGGLVSAGGAVSSTLRDCQVIDNSGSYGGGINNSTATNCLISGNRATQGGGGAYNSTLNNCLIKGNTSKDGGGVDLSTLINCVITGNSATNYGGGIAGGWLTNCVIAGNTAKDGGGGWGGDLTFNNCVITGNWATNNGGGVAQGPSGPILVNCLVTGNSATNNGGGAYGGALYNVTAVNNAAGGQGGGAYQSTLRNSIIYFNSAPVSPNTSSGAPGAYNCCLIPVVPGSGNFTNAPRFIDQQAGNYRLQTNSPCIGTGNNGYISIGIDLDGRPRIVGGTVDMGAYEFQGAGVGELTAWLQGYGLATDGSADSSDGDADGMNNWGEWRSDTIPTNALSVLRMVNATNSPTGAMVTWQSVSTRNYWLERATNLGAASPFQSVATNIVGSAGTKTYTDTSATNGGPYFYRVGVQ